MIVNSLYAFRLTTDYAVEWLAVREYEGLILMVPCDDTPMMGKFDVPLHTSRPANQATMFARCGLSVWVDLDSMTRRFHTRCGTADATETLLVRRAIGRLAAGDFPEGDNATEDDPEYWALQAELERLGLELSEGRITAPQGE